MYCWIGGQNRDSTYTPLFRTDSRLESGSGIQYGREITCMRSSLPIENKGREVEGLSWGPEGNLEVIPQLMPLISTLKLDAIWLERNHSLAVASEAIT
uniref:uncharacterized protein LOC105351746 isoform X2 n=1 Tax=Fragaria vesca subsp. vesca TaxID=101020 RepID=UPI0005CA65C7|nr:PREDICTED: uncharacterized protein LOC105351746 isoform X2 [Fragaria vesca subsp. vesca]